MRGEHREETVGASLPRQRGRSSRSRPPEGEYGGPDFPRYGNKSADGEPFLSEFRWYRGSISP